MYFWKTAKLASDIKDKNFAENDRKNYYLATSVLMLLGMYLGYLNQLKNMYAVVFEIIGVIFVTIMGVNITFKSNKSNDGSDYLGRMTALSFPLSIKLFLVSLLPGVILVISIELVLTEVMESWIMSSFIILAQAVFFLRLNVHIKNINT